MKLKKHGRWSIFDYFHVWISQRSPCMLQFNTRRLFVSMDMPIICPKKMAWMIVCTARIQHNTKRKSKEFRTKRQQSQSLQESIFGPKKRNVNIILTYSTYSEFFFGNLCEHITISLKSKHLTLYNEKKQQQNILECRLGQALVNIISKPISALIY